MIKCFCDKCGKEVNSDMFVNHLDYYYNNKKNILCFDCVKKELRHATPLLTYKEDAAYANGYSVGFDAGFDAGVEFYKKTQLEQNAIVNTDIFSAIE